VTAVAGAQAGLAPADRGRSAVVALAWVEARRMTWHPAFVLGLLASVAIVAAAVAGDADADWAGAGYYSAMSGWVGVWVGTLATAALAAGRGRLVSDPDLFPGVPLRGAQRVQALLLALVGPVAVTTLGVGAVAAVVGARGGFRQADPPFSAGLVAPSVLEWLQIPLLVALAGVVGIVIAHLPRGRALALLVVGVVTAMGTLIVWAFGAMPLRALHPLFLRTTSEPLPADFTPESWDGTTSLLEADEYDWWRMVRSDDATLAWHLVGVVGVALVLVALAIRLADRDDRRPARLAAIGAVVALASIGAQLAVTGPT